MSNNNQPLKAKTTKLGSISKTGAVALLNNNGSRIFSCTFVKKDGTTRKITCLRQGKQPMKQLGYLTVYDMNRKDVRKVNLQTMKTLALNGQKFNVK